MQCSWGTSPQGDVKAKLCKSLKLALFFSASPEVTPLPNAGVNTAGGAAAQQVGDSLGETLFCFLQYTLSIPIKKPLALSVC